MKQTKDKTLKVIIIVALALLMAGSWTFFAVAITSSGTDYDPGAVELDIELHTRETLLTCAYKVYGDDSWKYWVAKTVVKNVGDVPVYDMKISYKVGDYSDWTTSKPYPEILPGETVRDFCFPVLSGDVMGITTRTPAELAMKYEYQGLKEPVEEHQKIFLLGRNDYIFSSLREEDKITLADRDDNYPFVAAFCTPNEEHLKTFAEGATAGLSPSTSDEDALAALYGVFSAMVERGIRYIHEPAAFWAGESAQYVQYPKDTIFRKAGTCFDLAICVASSMEAVGVKSYVIFVPAHVIPAIKLPESGEYIPIESTAVEYGDIITAEYANQLAVETLNEHEQSGDLVQWIDLERWWARGIVPPW